MTLLEHLESEIRKKFNIPTDATITIDEQIYGGSCCHDSDTKETWIYWWQVPEGKKRKINMSAYYSGTVYDLIQEINYTDK